MAMDLSHSREREQRLHKDDEKKLRERIKDASTKPANAVAVVWLTEDGGRRGDEREREERGGRREERAHQASQSRPWLSAPDDITSTL